MLCSTFAESESYCYLTYIGLSINKQHATEANPFARLCGSGIPPVVIGLMKAGKKMVEAEVKLGQSTGCRSGGTRCYVFVSYNCNLKCNDCFFLVILLYTHSTNY